LMEGDTANMTKILKIMFPQSVPPPEGGKFDWCGWRNILVRQKMTMMRISSNQDRHSYYWVPCRKMGHSVRYQHGQKNRRLVIV
jgi:hypothetical protein